VEVEELLAAAAVSDEVVAAEAVVALDDGG